ncbi:MAG: hypothetical protein N4A54_03220 [Peptostreptococcaceae bacterium]|jgi:hypothetical protein|nr:hypothetical protein [Peptostreptococcaceae bacterium]
MNKESIKKNIYVYRYDLFSIFFIVIIILITMSPVYKEGNIFFSDIDFPIDSTRYMEEIFGLWNKRWSTSTLLNVPRLLYISFPWLVSELFNYNGEVFFKLFVTILLTTSSVSTYLFTKRLVSVYYSSEFDFFKIFALVTGALYYSLNPWVITRIQHIYLLCGHSLFPLIMRYFFDIIDPKFQKQVIKNFDPYRRQLYPKNIKDMLYFSFLFSVFAAAIHYFFYGVIYFSILSFLIYVKNMYLIIKNKMNVKLDFTIAFLKRLFVLGTIAFVFCYYWLFSYIGSILFKAQASQHNINVIDTLSLFSRNSSFKNVLYLISYWWPMFDINHLDVKFYISGGIILIFIFIGIITRALKNAIILFFALLSMFFLVMSTGVTNPNIADYFVILVTKTPVIGSIFRDPNKFIGLLTISFSILLTFGVEEIFYRLKDSITHMILKGSIVILVVLSMLFYISPFHKNFVDGFYKAVKPDKSYIELNDYMKSVSNDNRALYVPVADNMTQPHTGVATPRWNQNDNVLGFEKATGDVHVYNSYYNTIFHHEGNDMNITYLFNYIQYILDNGITFKLEEVLKALPINQLIYHNQYKGQLKRQNFNEDILNLQEGLNKTYENNIFSIYDMKNPTSKIQITNHNIFTPYGFSTMLSYLNFANYTLNNQSIIYLNSTLGKQYIKYLNEGDYLDVKNNLDIVLSNLDRKNYVIPFEYISDGNAFMRWSKTFTKNSDWSWFLESLNIKDKSFPFDSKTGVALTFATSKIDLPVYKMKELQGDIVLDFDSMLRTNNFFEADNPDIFRVEPNPVENSNYIPILKGSIAQGVSNDIWQVAKSGYIDIEGNNPYQFNIVISGRGINKLHAKVKFFDKDLEELGVSYLIAPNEETNYNEINLFGECVSPNRTKFMRIDLLSFRNENQKTSWWVHDINITDLKKYKKDNMFRMNYESKAQKKNIYARVYKSNKAGLLELKLNDEKSIYINTFTKYEPGFKWLDLGSYDFKDGKNNIDVYNRKGFNAVNLFAVLSEEELLNYQKFIDLAYKRANIFTVLEAEIDMDYTGNIQSSRIYPNLSLGHAISSAYGILKADLEIVKNAYYNFDINFNLDPKYNGSLKFLIKKDDGEIIYEQKIDKTSVSKNKSENKYFIKEDSSEVFNKKLKKADSNFENYTSKKIEKIPLLKGKYNIEIAFDSNLKSILNLEDLKKFNIKDIQVGNILVKRNPSKFESCEKITADMTSSKIENNILKIKFEKTCSPDWYVYASDFIYVKEDEEYLINFDMISEHIRDRHIKIICFDSKGKILDTIYVNEVEEKYKKNWNHYSQLINIDKGVDKIQIQLLNHGHRDYDGYLEMKNFEFFKYKNFISVDNILLYENLGKEEFFNGSSNFGYQLNEVDTMKKDIKVDVDGKQNYIISFMESPNPLWKENISQKRVDVAVNGVRGGLIDINQKEFKLEIILRKYYYLGLIMFLSILLLSFLIMYYFNKKEARRNISHKKFIYPYIFIPIFIFYIYAFVRIYNHVNQFNINEEFINEQRNVKESGELYD